MIKKLRESRSKTKKDLYESVMSASAYENIENNFNKIRLGDLLEVINRLELTKEEFFYYFLKDRKETAIQQIRNKNRILKMEEIDQLIKENINNKKYFYTLKTIYHMLNDDIELARVNGYEVWKILVEYDELFAYDLFCLSHICHLFEEDVFNQVHNKLIKNFKKWRDFEEFYKVEIAYYLNMGRYFQSFNNFSRSIYFYEEAYKLSKKYNLGDLTGISLFRLGKLKNDEKLVDQSIVLLEIFDKYILNILQSDS